MKIDFQGRYRDIVGYLSGPNSQQQVNKSGEGFARLLSDVTPKTAQPTENKKIFSPEGIATEQEAVPDKGPMASIHLPEPEMKPPVMERIEAPGIERPEDRISQESVKRPTILGAERVGEARSNMQAPPIRRSDLGVQPLEGLPQQDRMQVVKQILDRVAPAQGIDPYLGIAVANAESSFNPRAVSSDGHNSKGLFQLLDKTANDIIERDGLSLEYRPFEPEQNAEIGVRYLRYLHDLFSKETTLPNNFTTYPAANSSSLEKLAVAAYNAGEGRVASAQDRAARSGRDPKEFASVAPYLPKTTQEYVERVMSFKGALEADFEEYTGEES